jgi:hypothetical protein
MKNLSTFESCAVIKLFVTLVIDCMCEKQKRRRREGWDLRFTVQPMRKLQGIISHRLFATKTENMPTIKQVKNMCPIVLNTLANWERDSDWDPRPIGENCPSTLFLFFEILASSESGWGGGRIFSSVIVFDRPRL